MGAGVLAELLRMGLRLFGGDECANKAIESAKRSKLDYESTSDLRLLLAC